MKVAIVSCHDFIEGYGSNAKIKAYALGLKKRGVDVELLFLIASTFNTVNKKTSGTWEGIPFRYLNKKSYRPKSFPGKLADNIFSAWFTSLHFFNARKKYDLLFLYSPTVFVFWPLILAAKLFHIPIVAEWTELHSLYQQPNSLKFRLATSINKFDEKNAHRFIHHLLVISRNLYNYYLQYFPEERLTLMPIIVNVNRFPAPSPEKKFTIGYLGSFADKDGVEGILRSFKRIIPVLNNAKLKLTGPMNQKAQIMASQLGINDKVEFTGHVSHTEIPTLLNNCDLLLMNRTDSRFANFGFPAKLGEYLASGCPTIVTRVGDVEEYLQHGVDTYMIEPENDDQLAEAILLRYIEYERFNEIGMQGRKTAIKYFSHEQHVDRLLEIFQKVLDREKVPG